MVKKTATSSIRTKMDQAEKLRNDLLSDIGALHKEGVTKHSEAVAHADKLAKQLKEDPENKKLQREYAATLSARDMFSSAVNMNQAIMDDHEDTE